MKTSSSMNGLNRMKSPLNGFVFILMSLLPTSSPAGTTAEQELPSAEFLEFLAEWETDQGEWLGPAQFEDDSFDQLFEDEADAENNINEVENAE